MKLESDWLTVSQPETLKGKTQEKRGKQRKEIYRRLEERRAVYYWLDWVSTPRASIVNQWVTAMLQSSQSQRGMQISHPISCNSTDWPVCNLLTSGQWESSTQVCQPITGVLTSTEGESLKEVIVHIVSFM